MSYFFVIFAPKHILLVLIGTASLWGSSNEYPHDMFGYKN